MESQCEFMPELHKSLRLQSSSRCFDTSTEGEEENPPALGKISQRQYWNEHNGSKPRISIRSNTITSCLWYHLFEFLWKLSIHRKHFSTFQHDCLLIDRIRFWLSRQGLSQVSTFFASWFSYSYSAFFMLIYFQFFSTLADAGMSAYSPFVQANCRVIYANSSLVSIIPEMVQFFNYFFL